MADANGNWVPDCNLALPGATGECGPMSNDLFGQTRAGNAYDPETMSGWGKRVNNWEFGTGIQHELFPSTGLEVTYYRRWFGNLFTTDNRAVGPADFSTYQITAPVDSRLPNGGGKWWRGCTGSAPKISARSTITSPMPAISAGLIRSWKGVDVIVNSRFGGIQLMGGYSTGHLDQGLVHRDRTVARAAGSRCDPPTTAISGRPSCTSSRWSAPYTHSED